MAAMQHLKNLFWFLWLFQSILGTFSADVVELEFPPFATSQTVLQDNVLKDARFVVTFDINPNKVPVDKMVELFARRFQYMSLVLEPETAYEDITTIFTAVANHNHGRSFEKYNGSIQIYPVYSLNSDKLEDLLQAADETNKIFAGTIQSLILSDFMPTETDHIESAQKAVAAIKDRSFEYQIGLHLGIKYCDNQLETVIRDVPSISHLVFYIDYEELYFINGVEWSLIVINSTTANCKSEMDMKYPNISFGFEVTWPDTNSLGTLQNQSSLIYFWTNLARLAKSEMFTVFIDQAFDSLSEDDNSISNSNGWWTSDFTEKISAPLNGKIVPFSLNPDVSLCDPCCSKINWLSYSRDNVSSTVFDPSLATLFFDQTLSDDALTTTQYVPFIQVVSERFNNMMLLITKKSLHPRKEKSSEAVFMQAVAWHNSIRSICETTPHNHVDLSVRLDYYNIFYLEYENSVHALLTTLGYINDISNKTINLIYVDFEFHQIEESEWVTAGRELKQIKTILQGRGFKLGVTGLASNQMKRKYRQHWMRYVLPVADVVYMRHVLCKDYRRILSNSMDPTHVLEHTFARHVMVSKPFSTQPGIFLDLSGSECNQYAISNRIARKFWTTANKMSSEMNIKIIIGPGIKRMQKSVDKPYAELWQLAQSGRTSFILKESGSTDTEKILEVTYNWITVGLGILFTIVSVVVGAMTAYCRVRGMKRKSGMFNDEAIEFFQGIKGHTSVTDNLGNNITEHVACLPYDTSIEINVKIFEIDKTQLLGSGVFGSVCMAEVNTNSNKIWTAVKSLHLDTTSRAAAMRSLLMEIKVLTYLGKHENVTQLIGAYTSEISIGKVYVFLELCHFGSLHGFLRRNQPSGLNQPSRTTYLCMGDDPVLEEEMLKWSTEVALGMEHVASRIYSWKYAHFP